MGYAYGLAAIVFAAMAAIVAADGQPLGGLGLGAVAALVAYATFRRDHEDDGVAPRYMAVFAFALVGLTVVLAVASA
ncbi:MAG TPA: hypothetical protein VF517_02135 [Thermoleophilaceae bacterium]|jgi:hypothetical protein